MVKQILKRVLPEKLIWTLGAMFPAKPFLSDIAQTERLVEYGWVYNNLPKEGKVLDVGSSGSYFAHSLASLGYQVYALDWKKAKSTHMNMTTVQADIEQFKMPIKFDAITCISALEHIALRVDYSLILGRLYGHLERNGILLITVPCGKPKVLNGFKVFDVKSFAEAYKKDYFRMIRKGVWEKVESTEVKHINMENKDEVKAIMCVAIRRVK